MEKDDGCSVDAYEQLAYRSMKVKKIKQNI